MIGQLGFFFYCENYILNLIITIYLISIKIKTKLKALNCWILTKFVIIADLFALVIYLLVNDHMILLTVWETLNKMIL